MFLLLFLSLSVFAQTQKTWVDSTYNAMSEDEKLGQLFMIRAHSNLGADHIAKVKKQITDYGVGGLIFFQGTPEKQVELTNKYQKMSKIPMFVAMDAEWGLGMRFKDDGFSYPKQLLLGAIQENHLIYDMGKDIARQLRRIGVHINFAPVVDINNNPNNPVINTRSFGEDKYNVLGKSYMYMMGMQDNGVMACAKHFPGHGDTDVDSHKDLPVITHDMKRLDSIELFPFKVLSHFGIESMMIAHLQIPAIDDTPNLPTTLSRKNVHDLLKTKIGFTGLTFTDALEMKGVTKFHKPGEVSAKALQAGNDFLLMPEDIGLAIKAIKKYMAEGKIDKKQVETSIKKILGAKYRYGLTHFEDIPLGKNLRKELASPKANMLKARLVENALTLVRNQNNVIPFQNLDKIKLASFAIGTKKKTSFQNKLGKYMPIDFYQSSMDVSSTTSKKLLKKAKKYDYVIVSLHDMSSYSSKDFGLKKSTKAFLKELNKKTKVILTVFGNPYSLKYFDDIPTVLVAYNEDAITQELAAQGLFGVFGFKGRLPVTASPKSKFNDGVNTSMTFRLGYAIPEAVGINGAYLKKKIDSLANAAISMKATPGFAVLVAKDGKIIFDEAYGHHTYKKKVKTNTEDIWDLASITKIAASTISIMKLVENGKIDIDLPLSTYLPILKNTNKKELTLREILTHHGGLKAWIKFYEKTITSNKKPSNKFYASKQSDNFPSPVTEKLYLKKGYAKSIWQEIYDAPMRATKDYKYSDLGYYLIMDMIQELTGVPEDEFVQETFYKSLGLNTMTYNPWEKFPINRIPPTENDKYFRAQTVQGYVHDMGAAMLDGVSGHAGLFSTTTDLAVIMQMLLNGGYYGGKQYLQPETIAKFTQRCKVCTRRGIGFDMLETNPGNNPNFSTKASLSTYGHLGFTGNATWVDPEHNLIFVVLANRTYPSMFHNTWGKEDFRPKLQEAVYDAMLN